MDLHAAEKVALDLVEYHGLDDWNFGFDKAWKRFGCCHYLEERITLSRILTELNEPYHVRDTILHEIAHALAGPGAGHGREWREIALQIGCSAETRYGPSVVQAEPGPRRHRPRHMLLPSCALCGEPADYVIHQRIAACSKCLNDVLKPVSLLAQ